MAGATFHKLLIANRGEIACRVIRSARELGYRTVAVCSEPDREAPHAALADQAVMIGPASAAASYLNIERLLDAARATGADAVHPGYGFLAENAAFAEACAKAGLTFVGPPAEAMRLMGNKAAAKRRMLEAGVPCVPGYQDDDQDPQRLRKEAAKIGYPVLIKAAAGGGGRGMRLVSDEAGFDDALESARSEARNAFGDDTLILERAVQSPRHVEVQVFADTHGNVIHLGERDCSVQRRHQKVIEEAPAPGVTPELRAAMGEAACQAARAINYVGAGTIEFLLDRSGEFFFMEMNTRLQVEHPVTELVTGQDLVAWQLDVAAGHPLPLSQEQVALRGHAMEVRLYAEDAGQDFLPQSGRLLAWQPPAGAGVRVDAGIAAGFEVSPHYDPMIAKIIAFGDDRDSARRRLRNALAETVVIGPVTNRLFLMDCLEHQTFAAGEATTHFIGDAFADGWHWPEPSHSFRALGSALLYHLQRTPQPVLLADWHSIGVCERPLRARAGETTFAATIMPRGDDTYGVRLGEEDIEVALLALSDDRVRCMVGGVESVVHMAREGDLLYLQAEGEESVFEDVLLSRAAGVGDAAGDGSVRAPMNGAIIAVHVAAGEEVTRGQRLAALEAMKMEHVLKAPVDGVVKKVNIKTGDQVATRQVLVEIEAAGQPGD